MYQSSGNQPLYVGYIACLVSVVFFGSNLAVVKKYNTGDGFFFNWVYCSAIWIVGLIINMLEDNPQFYPLAMVGGVLWATGGLCVSLILRCIGLGLGVCIWATFNLIIGWACGRFGLFGLHPRVPKYEALNYIACVLSLISAIFYLSVKSANDSLEERPLNVNRRHRGSFSIHNDEEDSSPQHSPTTSAPRPIGALSEQSEASISLNHEVAMAGTSAVPEDLTGRGYPELTNLTPKNVSGGYRDGLTRNWLGNKVISLFSPSPPSQFQDGVDSPENDLLIQHNIIAQPQYQPPEGRPNGPTTMAQTDDNVASQVRAQFKLKKRLIGSLLAIFSGCLYGVNFVPVIYIQDNYPKSSNKGLPYIFAHFSGIYAAATIYFFLYCLYKNGQPWVSSALIVPTMVSGAMWAIATCAWFVANEILTQTISFPIIASLPPIVAGFWGLFVFKEISGRRNVTLLTCAFLFSLSGAILAGLSF